MLQQQRRLTLLANGLRKVGLLRPAFRLYELALAAKSCFLSRKARSAPDGLPIPPPDLIVQVAGTADVDWFLNFGKSAFDIMLRTLDKNDVKAETMRDVLEFGCGCGRVLRCWRSLPAVRIHGTDYNPRMIKWCRRYLPFGSFATNRLHPPLSYGYASFDGIYAISVFTHMSEPLQREWMRELSRILRPGGWLFITTQGASYLQRLSPGERAAFEQGRMVVRYEEASGLNLCSAYHPEAYVRKTLAQGYEVTDFLPAGSQGLLYQDLYLFRAADEVRR
jgi:SAM-dependent methyltransferase